MNTRVLLAIAVIVSAIVLLAGPASATSVSLVNPLFQDPTPTTCWNSAHNPGPYDSVDDGVTTNYPTGWKAVNGNGNPDNDIVEYNPTSSDFASADGNGLLPSPTTNTTVKFTGAGHTKSYSTVTYAAASRPTLGSQACYNYSAENGDGDNDIAVLANLVSNPPQTSLTLQKNTIYTETISVGRGLIDSEGWFAGFGIEIADVTAGGSLVSAEFATSLSPAAGTFQDFTITFNGNDYITAKGSNQVGDVLRVGFIMGTGTYITNVRVDVTSTVPEPSSLLLLTSGLVGLLAYAWRKRK